MLIGSGVIPVRLETEKRNKLDMATKTSNQEGPHVLSVPVAGRKYFDLGRAASYEAARRGDIPIIRIGRKLLVPVRAIERMLSEARPESAGGV